MRTALINRRREPDYFPYFKVQFWSARDRAWLDAQKRFPTPEAAGEYGAAQVRGSWRIMEVTRTGRRPLQTFEPPPAA